jgi:hypothetical protein
MHPSDLPHDFDWRAYLKWNPELEMQGVHTMEAAEDHYLSVGHAKSLVYRDFELTIRYTACGGLMNQHYCHMAALALAHMAKADKVVWPPMQVRFPRAAPLKTSVVFVVVLVLVHPAFQSLLSWLIAWGTFHRKPG